MGTTLESVAGAAKMLGAKGKKLHTHSMNVARTDNKGFIATHELRDRNGNPPTDGQRSQKIYSLKNHAELAAHVAKHLGDAPEESPEEEASESPQVEAAEGE